MLKVGQRGLACPSESSLQALSCACSASVAKGTQEKYCKGGWHHHGKVRRHFCQKPSPRGRRGTMLLAPASGCGHQIVQAALRIKKQGLQQGVSRCCCFLHCPLVEDRRERAAVSSDFSLSHLSVTFNRTH